MTLIIALRCSDGIVMAADGMSTEAAPLGGGALISKHEVAKIVAHKEILWGASGAVGVKQSVQEAIQSNYPKIYKKEMTAAQCRTKIADEILEPILNKEYQRAIKLSPGVPPLQAIPQSNFLFGAYFAEGFRILSIEYNGAGEVGTNAHAATGSGQKTGQALLRRLRNQNWTVATAEVIAHRTINDAIHIEPSGIGPPIQVARCSIVEGKPVAHILTDHELNSVSDAAQLWTQMEQDVLASLLNPPTTNPPQPPP